MMYIRQLSNGLTRVHMHDEDEYEITDDKGVNVDFSPDQLLRLVRFAATAEIIMPLPETWFVYDQIQGDFITFFSRDGAQAAYDKLIKEVNDSIGRNDEYDGDEAIYMGQVHKHAQVVPVSHDDEDNELFALVSYSTLPDAVTGGGRLR